MQIFITDYNFYKSASNLDTKRLGSQIYEGIHILASLLNINDKLVNPKRNIKNHPAAKLWVGYESELWFYISEHLRCWEDKGYKTDINLKNILILKNYCNQEKIYMFRMPDWITDELIQTHRSVLIQKEIKASKKINSCNKCVGLFAAWQCNICYKEKNYTGHSDVYHYRNLWPDCPTDLKMRYDWRK